ncbi:hypothetical protein ACIQMJ_25620 [Actinosynnema sp. NPDC091369]
MSTAWSIFSACQRAVAEKIPTSRPANDKEFHFQNWVYDRITEAGYRSSSAGRNTYPDFSIDGTDEAYEVKGITVGSRERDFDSNSALPSGVHQGRQVFYVFGRYDNDKVGGENPVVHDIVIVHGSFLNAGQGFVAANRSLRVLGSYGDILLRDRKMYAPYTPYKLLGGVRDECTLVLPSTEEMPAGFTAVGQFDRIETDQIPIGYKADLKADTLVGEFESNPSSGVVHSFVAYRTQASGSTTPVDLVSS